MRKLEAQIQVRSIVLEEKSADLWRSTHRHTDLEGPACPSVYVLRTGL